MWFPMLWENGSAKGIDDACDVGGSKSNKQAGSIVVDCSVGAKINNDNIVLFA